MKLESLFIGVALLLIVGSIVYSVGGCRQIIAKKFGGSITINLEENRKLVNCTWKDSQLWLLTTSRNTNEIAKSYKFEEKSTLGVLQGEVSIVEK